MAYEENSNSMKHLDQAGHTIMPSRYTVPMLTPLQKAKFHALRLQEFKQRHRPLQSCKLFIHEMEEEAQLLIVVPNNGYEVLEWLYNTESLYEEAQQLLGVTVTHSFFEEELLPDTESV